MGCGMTSCGHLKKAHKKSYFVQSIGGIDAKTDFI